MVLDSACTAKLQYWRVTVMHRRNLCRPQAYKAFVSCMTLACDLHQLHQCAKLCLWWFCRETETQIQRCLEENRQLANVWTPMHHYSVRTSMYNKDARSESVAPVNNNRNLISSSASAQERDILQQEHHEVSEVCASSTRACIVEGQS